MEDKVTLIVKAPNQSVPDQQLECEADWEVSRLKEYLSTVHPSKPRVSDQRLIYSGHLLADHLRLRSVLRHPTENNAYTVHLVCSPSRHTGLAPRSDPNPTQVSPLPEGTSAATSSMASREPLGTPSPGPSSPPSSSSDAAASNGESSDGLRRRNINTGETQSVTTPQGIEASAGYPAGYTASTQATLTNFLQANAGGDPIQQMATMQHIYASYMAYMQYIQMGGGMAAWPQQLVHHLPTSYGAPSATAAEAASPLQGSQQQPQEDQNAQPQPAEQQPEQPQPQAPQQIRMNAQGGEVLDDDDENEGLGRDWLDWMYVLSRVVVLLSIVYFYSTISRFMIVVAIGLLLYLYQAGWFRPARRAVDQVGAANAGQDERNNNNNNNNNNVDNERPQDGEGEGAERAVEEEEEAEEGGRRAEEGERGRGEEEIQGRQSFLALSWTFITTFFTSLIPEQPQML